MAMLLRMPEVAASATSAILLAWNKRVGDSVAAGEVVAEIESDKAVVEYAAEADGTLGHVFLDAGQEADVGAPMAVLLAPGETMAEAAHLLASVTASTTTDVASPLAESAPQPAPVAVVETAAKRILASPLARRLARERGIDLDTCTGSGPGGRIVKRDLDAVRQVSAVSSAPYAAAESAFREIPHSGMRRTIARRLSESKASIPHFYLSVDCRVDRLLALRAEFNATRPRRVSINDFIVRAAALALSEVPEANVAWTDAAMRQFTHADISIAVATDDGLITPIVRRADTKSVSEISADIAELAEKARTGKLQPGEYQGGSFSISNLGMYGVDEFSAIVNPPQAAILAVGAVQSKPVVEDGALVVGSVLRCTLSVDHRAIDGALAGRWLAALRRAIESPLSLLA
ncbi:MAG: dihydrolipoamide acetyltransferase family protein [Stenotrophomonas sp.]